MGWTHTSWWMDTILHLPETGRPRRYSATFKAEVVAACLQPGVSTTAIALAYRINPNLVRKRHPEAA